MENNLVSIDHIENMIYEIRGVQVMLDSDLAKIYHVETKQLVQAVKRNIKRFPKEFMFQLNDEEFKNLRSQFVTSGLNNNYGGRRYNPYVFTEHGVTMLSAVLKSDIAINTSIIIIKAFVKMRHYINYTKDVLPNKVLLLEQKVDDNTKRINELFDKFSPKDIIKDKIVFNGEFYDAYSLLLDIFNQAKKEIIIIDNYAGKELLDLLKRIKSKIIIVSSNIDDTLKEKYLKQYSNVTFINNTSFHDRFIIIDKKKLYTCGSSFKDIGKKCTYIGLLENKNYLKELLRIIGDIYGK